METTPPGIDLLVDWMRAHAKSSLCIFSPHLDDAVYSLHGVLAAASIRDCVVVSVVTEAQGGIQSPWAKATGFEDDAAEHHDRRLEDQRVMSRLHREVVHLGAYSNSAESIRGELERFIPRVMGSLGDRAVLLPAGSGRYSGLLERVCRKIARKPNLFGPHPEHLCVRDTVIDLLSPVPGAAIGFYVEMPYKLHDRVESAIARLRKRTSKSMFVLEMPTNPGAKLAAAEGYASQAELLLGGTPSARLEFASVPEHILLPV